MTTVRTIFIALTILWVILVPAATFAASPHAAASSDVGAALVWIVYRIGAMICHQRSERSFSLFATQMPVCARCAGIYAGAALIAVGAVLRLPGAYGKTSGAGVDARTVLIWSVLPAAATVVYEWTTAQMPGNWLRAASGLPIGIAVAWVVCCAAAARSDVM
jgi:uncharacterized membrane protein